MGDDTLDTAALKVILADQLLRIAHHHAARKRGRETRNPTRRAPWQRPLYADRPWDRK